MSWPAQLCRTASGPATRPLWQHDLCCWNQNHPCHCSSKDRLKKTLDSLEKMVKELNCCFSFLFFSNHMLQLQTSQHTAKLTSCEWWVREPGDGWCVCNELHNCRRATAISKTFSSQSTSAYHRCSVQVPLTASWAGLQTQGAVFVMLYLPLHPLASACGATCLVLTAASWSGMVTLHFYCQSEWWDLPIDCT